MGLAAVILCLPFWFGMPQRVYYRSLHGSICKELEQRPYIVHAAGAIKAPKGSGKSKKYKYSNCLEALENTYQNGNRIVELDFMSTADGKLVCMHSWEEMTYTTDVDQSNAALNGEKLTLDQFLSARIYGHFTPMTIDDVIDFMQEHEDLVIVSDTKPESDIEVVEGQNDTTLFCDYINSHAPRLKDRIIVQIYQQGDYDEVRNAGFEHIIYTLYRLKKEDKLDTDAHRKFAATHQLVGITFQKSLMKNEQFMRGMKRIPVPLFVHTLNGKKKAAALEKGITAVYTDDAVNEAEK